MPSYTPEQLDHAYALAAQYTAAGADPSIHVTADYISMTVWDMPARFCYGQVTKRSSCWTSNHTSNGVHVVAYHNEDPRSVEPDVMPATQRNMIVEYVARGAHVVVSGGKLSAHNYPVSLDPGTGEVVRRPGSQVWTLNIIDRGVPVRLYFNENPRPVPAVQA